MKKLSLLSILMATASLLFTQAAVAACGEIVLGSAISLTGKYSTEGVNSQEGYDFAVARINQLGGVKVDGKCYHFKVIYYDDESKGDRVATLAERLISQDNVQYMLGPYSSGQTKAIAPITEKYQIPMVQAEGASRSLFNKGYRYMFAVLSTSEQYLSSAVGFAAEQAQKQGKPSSSVKVAIAVENDPFSLDVRDGVVEDTKKLGMQIIIDEKLPTDLSDMSAILTKVQLLKPDLLIISGHTKGAVTAVRQIGEKNIKVPMIAMTHCESADIVGKFGKTADDFICSTQWDETMTYKDPIFGSASKWNSDFKLAYPEFKDKTVPYQTAQASAAVLVFKDAFERANSLDKEKLRDALAATDMETFYGHVKFAPEGNNIAKPMALRQIQNGEYRVVAPSKFATDKVNWPRM